MRYDYPSTIPELAAYLQSLMAAGKVGDMSPVTIGERIMHLLLFEPTDRLMNSSNLLIEIGDLGSDLEIGNGETQLLWRQLQNKVAEFVRQVDCQAA